MVESSDLEDIGTIAEESQTAVLTEQIVLHASKRPKEFTNFEVMIMAARERETKLMSQWDDQSVVISKQAGRLSELE